MKRLLFTLACATAIFTSHPAFAGSGLPDTDSLMHFTFEGTDREYRLAIPDSLDESRPLVIMMHGYGGNADPDRFGMKQAALKHGFAICFPQGERDTTGKTGWNIGYPAQKGMKTDDVEFISSLAEHIVSEYNLNPDNVFCAGYSNGGDLCYLIADRKPDEFAALASISGLTMKWVLNSYESTKQIPFIEFHGTADKTSRWGGDPDNTGGWGEYISVPLAVGYRAAVNRCTHEVTETRPAEENGVQVIVHKYTGGQEGNDVWLYEVIGGTHSLYTSGLELGEEIMNFFNRYLTRPEN